MEHLKKEIINDIVYNFYEGADFNIISNHNKSGQDGIMYIFIEDWVTYEQKLKRQSKINQILFNHEPIDINDVYNSFIIIYISGDINVSKMLDIIIDKIKKIPNNNLNIPLSSQ